MKANRQLLLLLVTSLVFAGLVSQRGELAGLTLPLLTYLAVAVWKAPEKPSLVATRTLERNHARPGENVAMVVNVANQGSLVEEVTIEDTLPPGVELVDGRLRVHLSMDGGAAFGLDGVLNARRGEYVFGPLEVEVSETLGLYSVRTVVSAPLPLPAARPAAGTPSEYLPREQAASEEPAALPVPPPAADSRARRVRLSVEPVGEALRQFVLRPPQTRGFAGPVPSRQGGRGTDFFIVREYQAGDSLRQINWKVSSRSERVFYTNVFEQQRLADVGIILDAREQSDLRARDDSLFEHAVQAATGLAGPILKAGNRLGLLIYGPGLESVFPGYGKVQQRRIQRALARAQTGHNYALESLAHLPTRFFPASSQIILISPLLPEDPPWVARLRTLGYGVLVVSPNPLAFEFQDQPTESLPYRLAQAERRYALQRLQRAGVRVIDWDVRRPLAPLVARAVRRA